MFNKKKDKQYLSPTFEIKISDSDVILGSPGDNETEINWTDTGWE